MAVVGQIIAVEMRENDMLHKQGKLWKKEKL